jgi:uncharacterized protein YdeI (YjbR/CyaY-like superfamily)
MSKKIEKTTELPIVSFDSVEKWEAWLSRNHNRSLGVWLCLQKKGAGVKSVTYAEALEVALCYGWIDGQKQPNDKDSWLQNFTRRRARSSWSKKNTEHAERLIRAGKMKPPGIAEVDAAKKDGRWKAAYDSQSKSTIPEDFLKELSRDKKALAFFNSLNNANLYSIAYRLQTAKKPETREKRMKKILEMMSKGKRFH